MSSQNTGSIHPTEDKVNSCILQCNKKLQLLVPPIYCRNLGKGIITALNKLTEGYCKELGGLVIGYKNVQVVQGSGWIHSTNPFIHIHVKANFDIFIPTKGFCIEGVVNEISNYKVSFLAFNKFNVVYRTQDVRNKLTRAAQLKKPNAATCRAALEHLDQITPGLKEGDTCTLLLHEVAFRDFLPHLRGYPVPRGLDTSSLLSVDTEQVSHICSPPAHDGSASRKVRFSDQESEGSDMAETSMRDIQLLTPPMSHGGRTSDSDDESGSIVLLDNRGDKKRKKKDKHAELGSVNVKREELTPPKMLDLPDIGRLAGHDSDGSLEERVTRLPLPQSKKKRRSNAGSVAVNVRTLQRMIESCALPEPTADDTRDFTSGEMIAVKKEILDIAEGGSSKRKKNKHMQHEPLLEANGVVGEDLDVSVTTKNKKKIKSRQLMEEGSAVSSSLDVSEKTSKKRKSSADFDQIDSSEALKPRKKKRKLNLVLE